MRRVSSVRNVLLVMWVCGVGCALSLKAEDVDIQMREAGMIYLDVLEPEMRPAVILNVSMPVYMTRDVRSVLAMLPPETRVEIVAVEEDYLDKVGDKTEEGERGHGVYRVRAQLVSRRVEGWMRGEDMPKVKREVVLAALAFEKRRVDVNKAIEEKRVLEGMTMEEVRKSLGKPDRVSFRRQGGDNPQRIDVWGYLIYERVMKTRTVVNGWGLPVVETYFEKEVVGEKNIEFLNDAVVAVEEHKYLRR